jgi:5'-3' exonuclease
VRALIDGDVLLHATLWETTNETAAIKKLLYNIEDYTLGAFCDDYIIAVGPYSGKNFRDDIFPEYKQTGMRVKGRKERPEHFNKVKDYLYSLDSVAVADNLEADDLLGIWSTQARDTSVIVTVDKDMDQLPGVHYNPRKDVYYLVSEEQAKMFFLKQLLMGDPMDNIPGLPKLGPIKAEKIISVLESSKAAAAVVLDHYFLTYGENWVDYFLSNGKLLWLQRSEQERFTLENFKRDFLNDGI